MRYLVLGLLVLLMSGGCDSEFTCESPATALEDRVDLAADLPPSARLCNASTLSFEGFADTPAAAQALRDRLVERGWSYSAIPNGAGGEFEKGGRVYQIRFDETSDGITAGILRWDS